MRIDEITIHKVRLPFVEAFSHSLSKGAFADNVIIELVAEDGEFRSYGECAPRSYVTGESQETIPRSISQFLDKGFFPWDLEDVSQVWVFVDSLTDEKGHNAALCGLEMSLMDLLGNKENRSIITYFPQDFACDKVHYGAVLPLAERDRIFQISRFVRDMGISRLKLKMGKDIHQNKMIMDAVSSVFENGYDLKIDINCGWDLGTALEHVPLIRDYKVNVVEQPMMPEDPGIEEFSKALQPHRVRLMADESACAFSQVEDLVHDGYYNMINVRLSKCGGFRRSLKIVNYLREKKIPFQVACQLGESGILSAAGRILSLLCKDAVYHDGSYDEFLLKENITESHVSFGANGMATPLGGIGLGVRANRQNLERMSNPSGRIHFWRR